MTTVNTSNFTPLIGEPIDFGQAISLNGSAPIKLTDRVSSREGNTVVEIFQDSSNFSVMGWIKPASLEDNNANIVYTERPAGLTSQALVGLKINESGNLSVVFNSGDGFNSQSFELGNGEITADNWSSIAVTFDSGTLTYYANGNKYEQSGLDSTITATSDFSFERTLIIGGDADDNNYEGQLDELSFWDRTISETEVRQFLYNERPTGSETDLKAYYTFDNDEVKSGDDTITIRDLVNGDNIVKRELSDGSILEANNNGTLSGTGGTSVSSNVSNFIGYIDITLDAAVTSELGMIIQYELDTTETQGIDIYNSQIDISTTDDSEPFDGVFIPQGEDSARIYLTALPDAIIEDDATITLNLLEYDADLLAPFEEYDLGTDISQTFTLYDTTDSFDTGLAIANVFGEDATSTNLVADEDGNSFLKVKLTSEPTDTVTVTLSPSDGTLSATSLSFDADNWDTFQEITVSGLTTTDDTAASITVNTSSSDTNYAGVGTTTLTIDDDSDDLKLKVTEGGTTEVVTPTVSISATNDATEGQNQPGAFTVSLDVEAPDEGLRVFYSLSDDSNLGTEYKIFDDSDDSISDLRFVDIAPGETTASIVVDAIDDQIADGDTSVTVNLEVDSNYQLNTDSQSSSLDVVDNESEAIELARIVNLVDSTNDTNDLFDFEITNFVSTATGANATISVALKEQPTTTVTLALADGNGTTSSSFTFDSTNYETSQSATLSLTEDTNGSLDLLATTDSNGDTNYADLSIDLPLTQLEVEIGSRTSLTTSEAGDSLTFGVRLSSQPTAAVTLDLKISNSAEAQFVSSEGSTDSLTFSTTNWDTYQIVTIEGIDDGTIDGNQIYNVSVKVNSASAATYDADPTFFAVTNQEGEFVGNITEVTSDSTIIASVVTDTVVNPTEGETAQVEFILSEAAATDLTLQYLVFTKTADEADFNFTGEDFTAIREVTIAAGLTSATVDFSTIDDLIDEADETFEVALLPSEDYRISANLLVTSQFDSTSDTEIAIQIDPTENVSSLTLVAGSTLEFGDNEIVVIETDTEINNASATNVPITLPTRGKTELEADTDFVVSADTATTISEFQTAESQTALNLVVIENVLEALRVGISDPNVDSLFLEEGTIIELSGGAIIEVNADTTIINDPDGSTLLLFSITDDSPVQSRTAIQSGETSVTSIGGSQNVDSTATLTIVDNDDAGLTFTQNGTSTDEAGTTTSTIDVVLDTQPQESVFVYLASSDSSEGLLSDGDGETDASFVELIFTPENWNTSQQVTVTGVDDNVEDGEVDYNVLTNIVSADYEYNEDTVNILLTSDVTISAGSVITLNLIADEINIADTTIPAGTELVFTNGTMATVVNTTSINNTTGTNVTVRIDEAPDFIGNGSSTTALASDGSTEVDIIVASALDSNALSLQLDDEEVTFVTLTRPQQLQFDNGIFATIREYTPAEEIILSPGDLGITDGGVEVVATNQLDSSISIDSGEGETDITATIGLRLRDDDTNSVTLPSGTEIIFDSGSVFTLTEAVTLDNSSSSTSVDTTWESDLYGLSNLFGSTAVVDIDTTQLTTDSLILYEEELGSTLSYTNTDDDEGGINVTLSDPDLAIAEGNANNFFNIVLNSEPTEEVEITIIPSDNNISLEDEVEGESVSVVFDSSNWNLPRTIEVTAVDDTFVEFDHTSTISFNVTTDDDVFSDSTLVPGDIEVFIQDNDLPTASVESVAAAIEANAPGYFAISLDTPVPDDFDETGLEVSYTISGTADTDGTFPPTDDVQTISGTTRIAPGATSSPLIAFPIDDFKVEAVPLVVNSFDDGTNSLSLSIDDSNLNENLLEELAETGAITVDSGTELTLSGGAIVNTAAEIDLSIVGSPAMVFDGVDDEIQIPSGDGGFGDFSSNSFAIEAWFRTTESDGTLIAANNSDGTRFWRVYVEDGLAKFGLALGQNPAIAVSSEAVNDGEWHHIAVVRPGVRDGILYLDGEQVDTLQTRFFDELAITSDVFIGSNVGEDYFGGAIDEVRVYRTFRQNISPDIVRTESNLIANYTFDNDSGTTVLDQTANGNDGTVSGTNLSTDGVLVDRLVTDEEQVTIEFSDESPESTIETNETALLREESVIVTLNESEDYQVSSDADTATLKIQDNDRVGVRIIEIGDSTTVTEGETGSEFFVSLLSEPEADVTVTLSTEATSTAEIVVTEAYDADAGTIGLEVDNLENPEISSLLLPAGTYAFSNGTVTLAEDQLIGSALPLIVAADYDSSTGEITLAFDATQTNDTGLTLTVGTELRFDSGASVTVDETVTFDETTTQNVVSVTLDEGTEITTEDSLINPTSVTVTPPDGDAPSVNETADYSYTELQFANGTNSESLTFTSDNWFELQSVTVEGVDDAVVETGDLHTGLINYSLSSDDSFYDGLTVDPQTINIRDRVLDSQETAQSVTQGLLALQDSIENISLPIIGDFGDVAPSFFDEFIGNVAAEIRATDNLTGDSLAEAFNVAISESIDVEGLTVEITGLSTDEISLFLGIEDSFEESVELNSDLGLPALNISLESEGSLDLDVGYNAGLAFGINTIDGFFLDTENTSFEVSAGLNFSEDFSATGELGFVQVDVTNGVDPDEGDEDGTGIDANFTVSFAQPDSITDEDGDDTRLTLSELIAARNTSNIFDFIDYSFTGDAALDLDFVTSIEGNTAFPTFGFNLFSDLTLFNYGNEEDAVATSIALDFNDLTLDAGGFVTDLISPVISGINDAVEPISPVIDALTAEIKLLESIGLADLFDQDGDGAATVLEVASTLAETFGEGKFNAVPFINAVSGVIGLTETLAELEDNIASGETIALDFGSYSLDLFGASDDEDNDASDLEIPDDDSLTDGSNQSKNTSNSSINRVFSKLDDLGITLDIVENPLNVVKFLLGQDIDLVTWDVPELDIGFGLDYSFPIVTGVTGELFGEFSAYSDLVFGFDTVGLSDWQDQDFALEESYRIFDGFYLSDVDPDTGVDVDELELEATIGIGASLNALIAKVTAAGGVTGNVGLDLIDIGEYEGESDGRIRGSEIISRIETPLELFELNGDLEAFLRIIVTVLGSEVYNQDLATFTLFEFSLGGGSSGAASNSYIFDSTVFFDANFNNELDPGEPFTVTDTYGRYFLPLPIELDLNNNGEIDVTEGQLVSIGGTDSSSGLPAGTLIALPGASIISPVTTLEAAVFNQGLSQEEADAVIQNQLGLDLAIDLAIDLDQFDPLEAVGNGSEAGLEVYIAHINTQALFNQVRSFLDGLEAADPDVPINDSNLEQVLFTLAETLVENEQAGTRFDLSDEGQLTDFFERVATDNGVAATNAQLETMVQIFTESIDFLDQVTLNALSDDEATPASTLPILNAVKRVVQGDVSTVARQLGEATLTPAEAEAEFDQLISQDLVLVGDQVSTIGDRSVGITSPVNTLGEDVGLTSVVEIELNEPAPNQGLNLFFTVSGTATGGDDFTLDTSSLGQFIVAPNQTNATLDLTIVDDNLAEDTETITITLETATEGFAIDSDNQSVTIEIQDNEPLIDDLNEVLGTPGRDQLTGTPANDRITGFQGRDTIDLLSDPEGSDILVYVSSRDAGDIVSGFQPGEDLINFESLFTSANITVSDYTEAKELGFISFGSRGSDALVLFDQDGNSGARRPRPFMTLTDVSVEAIDDPSNFVL